MGMSSRKEPSNLQFYAYQNKHLWLFVKLLGGSNSINAQQSRSILAEIIAPIFTLIQKWA
jgi:hypothetical protein